MLLFFTILVISILSGAEVDLFIPSFPELQKIFHLSPFMVQFMLSANLVAYCLCSLFSGALGDRYNRRHIMLISLLLFLLGSLLCVVASNYPVLVMGRILQGIGMAGPSVLSYPLISDNYSIEKQAAMLGSLNGGTTLAMAFAPVIGSYVNLFSGWRGNFVVLLALSAFCLVMGFFVIPNRPGNPEISLSPKTYWPLICSKQFLTFMLAVSLFATAYWIFIGMAPILYMQNLDVPLAYFGFYQGAVCSIFAIICFISPHLLFKFGQKRCLYAGMALSILSVFFLIGLLVSATQNPLLITLVAMLMGAGAVFPMNILFPLALTVVPDAKGRATAFFMAARLVLTAVMLELVSYFYVGTFFPIGLTMIIFLSISMLCIVQLLSKKWVVLQ